MNSDLCGRLAVWVGRWVSKSCGARLAVRPPLAVLAPVPFFPFFQNIL